MTVLKFQSFRGQPSLNTALACVRFSTRWQRRFLLRETLGSNLLIAVAGLLTFCNCGQPSSIELTIPTSGALAVSQTTVDPSPNEWPQEPVALFLIGG